MKHAGRETLDALEPLLRQLRALPALTERTPGAFYRKSRAFLHFHEDPKGLFADIRAADGGDFERLDVTSSEAQRQLVLIAQARLAGLA